MGTATKFVIGRTDYGKWLAISDRAPYFCLEADSESEASEIAHRALDFYFGISGRIERNQPVGGRSKTLSNFSSKRTVEVGCD